MNAAIAAALALTASAQTPDAGWTWTLYDSHGPVVLAEEIPDTRHLRTTLECEPRSGVARITLYGASFQGFATLRAESVSATAEAERIRDATRLTLPADHPIFTAFASDGDLTLDMGAQARAVSVPRIHLPKVRRFIHLCSAGEAS